MVVVMSDIVLAMKYGRTPYICVLRVYKKEGASELYHAFINNNKIQELEPNQIRIVSSASYLLSSFPSQQVPLSTKQSHTRYYDRVRLRNDDKE
mmetsp:Transcript_22652/g.47001  ORF Transcript_22652/g.47001 Transcript_22652/m.47001 type:complete len:94 (+) Transcript_22652:693-974(+)